jgi:hypothetical protein
MPSKPSVTLVQRFDPVVLGHEDGTVVPVHSRRVTFVVFTVPPVSASFALMSMSASGGTKLCASGGPPPLNTGTPACASGTLMRNESPMDHAIVATIVVQMTSRRSGSSHVRGSAEVNIDLKAVEAVEGIEAVKAVKGIRVL